MEKVNGLIFAVVMESRGIYMSADWEKAKKFGANQIGYIDRIDGVVKAWRNGLVEADQTEFKGFESRIAQFMAFRREMVRTSGKDQPRAAREFGDNDANRSVRTALNDDLQRLAKTYEDRTRAAHGALDESVNRITLLLSGLAATVLLLAAIGILVIRNAVTRPLAEITAVTGHVANGSDMKVPFENRRDEIGALARSIAVFQAAMCRNRELTAVAQAEAELRAARTAEVEARRRDLQLVRRPHAEFRDRGYVGDARDGAIARPDCDECVVAGQFGQPCVGNDDVERQLRGSCRRAVVGIDPGDHAASDAGRARSCRTRKKPPSGRPARSRAWRQPDRRSAPSSI